MIDREKVIKGIEHCINPVSCKGCPYRGKGECAKLLMEDALGLLIKMQDYIDTLNAAIKVAQNVKEEFEGVEMRND